MNKSVYEYDFVLSFAGEQRPQVEEVANLLREQGVTVFYDRYEKSTLWGRDLYQHLASIYSKKAKYCIVFASKEYAAKSWTNHELRNAQERAFAEKGKEYILPVRFDLTEIPGIPKTAGYLDFNTEGASGIAALAIEKLRGYDGSTSASQAGRTQFSCSASPRGVVSCSAANLQVTPVIVDCVWGTEVSLTFYAETEEDDAVFTRLREISGQFLVAYRFQAALATVHKVVRKMTEGKVVWSLDFAAVRQSFQNDYEMGIGSLTTEHLAKMRAERILLDMHRGKSNEDSSMVERLNWATMEAAIRGLNTPIQVERSGFPPLWGTLRDHPQAFLEIGWILAIAELKLTGTVEHVDKLRLELSDQKLSVDFSGTRHRKFMSVAPYSLKVKGELALESSGSEESLQ